MTIKRLLPLFLACVLELAFSGCAKTETDSGSRRYLFDPRIPGGAIGGTFSVAAVENLEADTSTAGQIKLTWKVSPLYVPLSYKIRIYRHRGNDPNWFLPEPSAFYNAADLYKIAELSQESCPVEIPTTDPPEYKFNSSQTPGNCNTWTDKGEVSGFTLNADADYKYWVYVFINNAWSQSSSLTANVPRADSIFSLPAAVDFWSKKVWDLGQKPSTFGGSEFHSYSTLEPKQTSCKAITQKSLSIDSLSSFNDSKNSCQQITGCSWSGVTSSCSSRLTQSECGSSPDCFWNSSTSSCLSDQYQCVAESNIGNMKGKVAIGSGGAVMYVADTDNNRIVIYKKEGVLACSQYQSDPLLYNACMFQFQGFPFQAANVLGQPNQYSTGTCNVSCQSKTTSNSCGATSGCSWSQLTSTCEPDFAYSQCMNKPNYVTIADDKLIVSDSGNNRLLVWDHLPTTGCDSEIISGQINETDCTPTVQIGKKSFKDFNSYNISIDGDKIFNNPTGTFVDDVNNLYVADTGNNRIVKISGYIKEPQKFSCNDDNWESSLCKFSSVLGQPSFFVNKTFKDFLSEDSLKQQTCADQSNPSPSGGLPGTKTSCEAVSVGCTWIASQITGQGSCKLTNPIIDNLGIGNIINSSYDWILRRYFSTPTVVKISNTGQFIVSANEDFETKSSIGSPIYLKSRVLIWDQNPIGTTGSCLSGTFPNGGCDAASVIGQSNFRTLVALQGSQSKYTDVSYGLESLDDLDIYGKFMFGVDYKNNFVYLWDDWKISEVTGRPPRYRVLNPLGAPNPSSPANFPNLKGISSISLDRTNLLLYITDPNNSKVYEIRF